MRLTALILTLVVLGSGNALGQPPEHLQWTPCDTVTDISLPHDVTVRITPPREVAIEIVPPKINPFNRGVIPVALFGGASFDVSEIDVATLQFGPDFALPKHDLADDWTFNEHLQDVNLDGHMDLMLHFKTQDTGVACGDTRAWLYGELLSGSPRWFYGSDSFQTVGCRPPSRPRPSLSERDRFIETDGRVTEVELEDSSGQQ